jgi:DNA-binding winged helix-turn-helix (wHTH) protein/TolB-like protein/Tfp pilus assembly protein PilF
LTSDTGSSRLSFGSFLLDPAAGELHRDGRRLKLPPQPFKVLLCLAQRSGQLVTREELAREVWGEGVHVDFEHGLNFCIRQIRSALEDDVDAPRFIETIPRRGYRFLPPVSREDASPAPAALAAGGTAPAARRRGYPTRWAVAGLALVLLAAAAVLTGLGLRTSVTGAASPELSSLAILPIENLSHDRAEDYLAETLGEAVTAELTHRENIRVRSRVSPAQWRQAAGSPAAAGRRLQADAVLQGSFARIGDQVWITMNLLQVEPERYLWAQTYTRDARDPLAWQLALAQEVSAEVSMKLQNPVAAPPPVHSVAAEDYLQGQYFWGQQTSRSLLKAVAFYRSAIEKDPGFAPAYAGLADSYIQLEAYGLMSPQQARELAREAARKGMDLDPTLAHMHEAMGSINLIHEWRWQDTEKECKRAQAIDPGFARAYLACANYQMALGHTEEAVASAHRAFELEPASLHVHLGFIRHLYFARRLDDAIQRLEDLVEVQPELAAAYVSLGLAEHARQDYAAALRHFRRAKELGHTEAAVIPLMAASLAAQGQTAAARRLLSQALQMRGREYVSPFLLARVYEHLGEADNAFRMLGEAYDHHAPEMAFLQTDPSLDLLRPDPRFAALVARLNLPQ